MSARRDAEITLTPDSVRRIAAAVRKMERVPIDTTVGRQEVSPVHYTKLGITTTAISARSGKTPGSGSVQPYTWNRTTGLMVLSGTVKTVKNWTGSVVATNKWVKFLVIDGALFLDGNDCSAVAS